jgi:hypothetical protein
MVEKIGQVAENLWNFRGCFRIGGVVDIGTQACPWRIRNSRRYR